MSGSTHADRDKVVFEMLSSQGADLSQPRHTLFYLYFPSQSEATRAQEELMGHWLASEGKFIAECHPSPINGSWPCRVEAEMVVSQEVMSKLTPELEAIASRHGGEYDGWECASQP